MKYFTLVNSFLMSALLLTTTIHGSVEEDRSASRVLAGERMASDEEKLLIENERSELAQESYSEESNAEELDYQVKGLPTHAGAYHKPYRIEGHEIELLDGSVWIIRPSSFKTVLQWQLSDLLFITPGYQHSLDAAGFTYNFVIKNETKGTSADVELYLAPFYNGDKTFWVKDIIGNTVILNDNSMWDISFWSKPELRRWQLNDTIILGKNKGLFSTILNSYILINCATKDFVRANHVQ